MVKAYLRYEPERSFGAIAGLRSNADVVGRSRTLTKELGARALLAVAPAADAVIVWNLRTGEEVARLVDTSVQNVAEVSALCVAPSGLRCAAGYADGNVRVWSVLTGKLEGFFTSHVAPVTSLGWGAVGKEDALLVSGSADGEVVLWDPVAERGRFRLHAAHSNAVTAVRIESGHIITASKDGLMKVYEIRTQSCVQTVVGHPGEIWCMDAENQLLVTGSVDQELRLWRMTMTEDESSSLQLTGLGSVHREGSSRCISVAFSKGGGLLAVHGIEKSIQFFNVRDDSEAKKHRRRRQKRMEEKQGVGDDEANQGVEKELELEAVDYLFHARSVKTDQKIRSISFVDSKKKMQLLVHLHHNLLEVLEVDFGTGATAQLQTVARVDAPGHRGDIRALALASDDRTLVSVSSARTVKVWNAARGNCLRTMAILGYGLCGRLIESDVYIVVGQKGGELQVFDVGSGEEVFRNETAHDGAIWSMDVLPQDFGVVTCGADRKMKFWHHPRSRNTKFELVLDRTLELGEDALSVVVTPNEKFVLVSLLDSTVRAFFLDTLKPYLSFYGHKLPVLDMDVSSDSTVLATASADKSVKLWGLDFGDCRRSLRAHDGTVSSIVFQPNTHYLFTGSRDGSIKYWDADRFELIATLKGQHGEVWSCVTSRDGELLMSGSHDKSIRVWKRTDEMMFVEEEKDRRLDTMLEDTLREGEKERRAAVSIVPEEVTPDSTLAGKRTLTAVSGAEGLMEAIQLGEQEILRRTEEPSEPASVELLGLSAELYVLRALKRLRRAELESALQLLPMRDAVKVLEFCSSWLADDGVACVNIELIARTVLYIVHTFQDAIASGSSRALIAALSSLLRSRMNGYRDNLGFNLTAIEYIQSECSMNDEQLPFLQPAAPRKRART